ncbi:peptidoglycan DD-metalloendopeptidase family protein [Methylobacter sp. YRD-M1]|uniref:peptidoglycan DD-metalloendopeptidase family protein n=1 Tax=Methylobacter sp. YRD-M1 TaxID=2911520 RepID=UPI00227D0C86|nr:M23 family metallopeptidase [Methylobacter sp. YRD-M1]WAK02667.1 M23 family metallopeptidase [Methylobacter sp. YRD-M1]
MRFRLLILMLSAFISFNAAGKKLYKFQDERGTWHFTDQPPKTSQQVTVRQMKVASKQRVWLLKSGEERQPKFYVRNDYAGPVEVEVSFAERKNVRSTPALPQRFIIAPGESDTLFEVGGMSDKGSSGFSLQYRYTLGSPLAQYTARESYLPPIAPDASFQISQAFDGSFSHTDEQNKYAVDIAMPIGTPVYAAKAGTVMEVDNDFYKGGIDETYSSKANSIRIVHADGSMAVYAHLEEDKAQVYPGLKVAAGQLIGYSGNTGFTSGPHLHFAIQINKGMTLVSVPFAFLNSMGQAEEPVSGTRLKGVAASVAAK